jgi:hypothetical protein
MLDKNSITTEIYPNLGLTVSNKMLLTQDFLESVMGFVIFPEDME